MVQDVDERIGCVDVRGVMVTHDTDADDDDRGCAGRNDMLGWGGMKGVWGETGMSRACHEEREGEMREDWMRVGEGERVRGKRAREREGIWGVGRGRLRGRGIGRWLGEGGGECLAAKARYSWRVDFWDMGEMGV